MRSKMLVELVCALSLVASAAAATTVLNTTQSDVKGQCQGKTSCSTACGSTLCDYVCDDPKKQCTVAIFLKKPPHTTTTHPVSTVGAAAKP
ncbi:MAG: hypothetical protein WDM85_06535 [Caulobacteraceae bacterium]